MQTKKLLPLIFVVIASLTRAEQVVTFVNTSKPTTLKARSYLNSTFRDEGYVSITAQVNDPPGSSCVAPSKNSFLLANKLDVTLTAQIFGFFGVDSTKEVPIATYSWTGEKYCRTVWQYPVLLVPPTPLGIQESRAGSSAAALSTPKVILRLRSTASSKEQLSSLAQSLLGIAGGLATGGAADTIVGITNIAGGPAAKFLSDKFNERLQNSVDQKWEVTIPWEEIVKGQGPKQVQLVARELETRLFSANDEPDQIIDQIHKGVLNGTPILTIDFMLGLKRTVFDDDANLDAATNLPTRSPRLANYSILNYPRSAGGAQNDYPTLFQKVNAEAPSLLKGIDSKNSANCDRIFVTVRDLGFNAVDRALISGALLDMAYPDWRIDKDFRGACLQSEPEVEKRLIAIFGNGYFPKPLSPVFTPPELLTNPDTYWTANNSNYMLDIRLALFSKGDKRTSSLAPLLAKAASRIDDDLDLGSLPGSKDPSSPEFLRDFAVSHVGCIFGFKDTGGNTNGALLFSARGTDGKNHPYIMIVSQDMGSGPYGLLAKNLLIYSLNTAPGSDFIPTFENATFGERSICYRGKPGKVRTSSEILADFSN